MKDEILAKALDSDTEIVPRYDVVLPDGTKVAENAEIVLKNPVTQEGTPYNKEAVLQDATAALYGLGDNATVDGVLQILKNAAVVNSAGDALETILGSTLLTIPGARIATGSYVGTGTYGSSNPNSLTFDFEPKLVIIQEENAGARDKGNLHTGNVWVSESTYGTVYYYSSSIQITNQYNTLTWGSNTLSWYSSDSASSQLNFNNSTYNYLAIG